MKTFIGLIIVFIIMSLSTLSFAEKGNIVYIPQDVKEVKYAEYSSGGSGSSAIIYVKVLCLMEDGSTILYTDSKFSVSGSIGLGRFTIPIDLGFIGEEEKIIQNEILEKREPKRFYILIEEC